MEPYEATVWTFVLFSVASSVHLQGAEATTTFTSTSTEQSTEPTTTATNLIQWAAFGSAGCCIIVLAALVVAVVAISTRKKRTLVSSSDDTCQVGPTCSSNQSASSPPVTTVSATSGIQSVTWSSTDRSKSMYVSVKPRVERYVKCSSQLIGHYRYDTKPIMRPPGKCSPSETEKRIQHLRESGYISHADI